MKIGICKFGKVTYFNPKSWTVKGGDNESCLIVQMLLDAGHQVYMLSKADVRQCKRSGIIPKERKLFDAWLDHRIMKKIIDEKLPYDNDQVYKSLDAVILLNGGMPNNAYPFGYNPYGLKTLSCYQRYVFPPMKIFQQYSHYWKKGSIYILVDNRYYAKLYDYCNPWNSKNPPKRILSQANQTITMQRKYGGPITYVSSHDQLQFIFMFGKRPVDVNPKMIKFVMFQHASGIPKWRWKQMQKYVFDLPFEFTVYGDWHDMIGKGLMTEAQHNNGVFKHGNAQFQPPLPLLTDLYQTYQKAKYTFVCSKGSTAKKWSTAKYLQAIMNGCIPFVPADQYDSDGVSIPKDSFLRVKDGKQLLDKINLLQRNEQRYNEIKNELKNYYCSEDKLNGKFILNKILNALEDK